VGTPGSYEPLIYSNEPPIYSNEPPIYNYEPPIYNNEPAQYIKMGLRVTEFFNVCLKFK